MGFHFYHMKVKGGSLATWDLTVLDLWARKLGFRVWGLRCRVQGSGVGGAKP